MPRVEGSEPTPGGFTSNNVEYVGSLPFEKGAGLPIATDPSLPVNPEILTATEANIRGDYLYLTSWKNISIYNISQYVSR